MQTQVLEEQMLAGGSHSAKRNRKTEEACRNEQWKQPCSLPERQRASIPDVPVPGAGKTGCTCIAIFHHSFFDLLPFIYMTPSSSMILPPLRILLSVSFVGFFSYTLPCQNVEFLGLRYKISSLFTFTLPWTECLCCVPPKFIG